MLCVPLNADHWRIRYRLHRETEYLPQTQNFIILATWCKTNGKNIAFFLDTLYAQLLNMVGKNLPNTSKTKFKCEKRPLINTIKNFKTLNFPFLLTLRGFPEIERKIADIGHKCW